MVYKANQLSLKNKQNHPITASLINLGCPKNQVLAEKMIYLLQQNQFHYSPFEENNFYHLVIVNTCGFLRSARQETDSTLELLSSYKKTFPEAKIVVLGCDAIFRSHSLKSEYPDFDFLADRDVLSSLRRYLELENHSPDLYQTISSVGYAYLQIADGCDHQCSYCLIPSIKGKYKSVPIDLLLSQAKNLVERFSIKELILVSQDTTSYGNEVSNKNALFDLTHQISKLPGIEWIRFLYHFPVANTLFFEELLSIPKVVPYLDIPLQHFSPTVLKSMNRPSPIEPFVEKLLQLRDKFPRLAVRSTFIVGYPTETENDFEYLLQALRRYPFDRVGFFPYSEEPNTKASTLQDPHSDQVKEERLQIAYKTQCSISEKLHQSWINKTLPTLLETYDPIRKSFIGRTVREAPEIDPKVVIHASVRNPRQLCGQINDIIIEQSDAYHIQGRLLHS